MHLPIKFRMNSGRPLELTARSFLRMAGIVEEDYTRYEHLDKLENTLRYMVEQGYISAFETERYRYAGACPWKRQARRATRCRARAQLELKAGESRHPGEPLEEMWRVEPPPFLRDMLIGSDVSGLKVQEELDELARTSAPKGPRAFPLLPGFEMGGRTPWSRRETEGSPNLAENAAARTREKTRRHSSGGLHGRRGESGRRWRSVFWKWRGGLCRSQSLQCCRSRSATEQSNALGENESALSSAPTGRNNVAQG